MNQRQKRRRIYIVDKEFQYGLIRKFAIIGVLMIVMSFSFIGAVQHLYGDVQVEVAQPNPFAISESISTLPGQISILQLLWPVLLICLLVTLIVTFFFGVIFSHRMAGPIYRVKRVLAQMGRGDLRGEIRLRKRDDFKSLAASVNDLKRSWRMQVEEMQKLSRKIETGDAEMQERNRERLNRLLSTFKTN